jgi:hypothetical protein
VTEVEIGQVFGAWEILEKLDYKQKYKCICQACGVTTQNIRVYDLIKGKTLMCKSCSQQKSQDIERPIEYHTWMAMTQRCYNPNSKDYKNYGARGITVCDLWRDSFEAFYMMVGQRPEPHYTIERIDTNGNYEPGNVRWATRDEQTRNQRSNVKLTLRGETKTVSEWALHPDCPVSQFTIYKRLKRGWDDEKAVFTPSKKNVNGINTSNIS